MSPPRNVVKMQKAKRKASEDLKNQAKAFIRDRKNANDLVHMLSFVDVEVEDNSQRVTAIQCLLRIFQIVVKKRWMVVGENISLDVKAQNAEKRFRSWLHDIYAEFKERLLGLVTLEEKAVSNSAMRTLLRFFLLECEKPTHFQDGKIEFPTVFLQNLVAKCLSETQLQPHVINRFEQLFIYNDACAAVLGCMHSLLKRKKNATTEIFMKNFFNLLELVTECLHRSGFLQKESCDYLMNPSETNCKPTAKDVQRSYSFVWLEFLSLRIPLAMYKHVLILMPKVLPNLEKPFFLTDFLIDSYKMGGLIGLLSLHGLFLLIKDYNLDYPDFYMHLYNLLTSEIFLVKYKARFFFLLDMFLSSTHLPEYLVAAYVKKLARLALEAPPYAIAMVALLIQNLLIRYPGLQKLVRSTSDDSFSSDNFNMNETDPAKCCVGETSLWELETLKAHYNPQVKQALQFINKSFPTVEKDLEDVLESAHKEVKWTKQQL